MTTQPEPSQMIPACTRNACGQDARNCKSREACHLPIDEEDEGVFATKGLFIAAVATVVMIYLGSVLADYWPRLVAAFAWGTP